MHRHMFSAPLCNASKTCYIHSIRYHSVCPDYITKSIRTLRYDYYYHCHNCTQQQVLGAMKAETRTQHKLTRTPSDPDIALYDDKEITPLELDQLDTLRTALLSYHDALDAVGLPDERVRRDAPQGTLSLLYGALLRALWAVLLLVLAAPGTVVLSPLLLCGKALEMWIILTNRGARRVRNLDEVSVLYTL
jgi:hypothetical protein